MPPVLFIEGVFVFINVDAFDVTEVKRIGREG
jgi:hypothetical protein